MRTTVEGNSPSEREVMRIHLRTNSGFFDFSHCRLFPLEYRLPARFETIPSTPVSQALANTSGEA